MVEIWLTNSEKNDPKVHEQLNLLYAKYKEYFVAVFKSGEGNLNELTSDLICYNRKKIAQIEVMQR